LTFFVSFEILRAALFLWITPFELAQLIVFMADLSASAEASLSFALTEASTAFTALFIVLFAALFLAFLFSVWRALFSAERFLFTGAFAAKLVSSL
jgi:hypothetical protein